MKLKVFSILVLMIYAASAAQDPDMEEAIKRSLEEQEEQENLEKALQESLKISHGSSGAAAASPAPSARPESPRAKQERKDLEQAMRESLMTLPGSRGAASARPDSPHREIQEWENLPFLKPQGRATMIDIGYDAPGRTDQYRPYSFPKAPMLHTYNPYRGAVGGEDHMWQGGHHVPLISVNLRARTDLFRDLLPEAARAAIASVPSENLDIFWIVQDNPWTASARVLFRPHYWADPTAPFQGKYNKEIAIHTRILSSIPDGISLSENSFGITIHPDEQGYVISSPNNASIPGASRPNETFSFWSLTQANGRTAITLHWFLNDQDNLLMLESIGRSHNLRKLLEVFNRISSYRGSHTLQSLLLPELNGFLEFHPRR
jgi:hypothetical protein